MPTVALTGLGSGVEWGAVLEQLKRAETARRVGPLEARATLQRQRVDGLVRFRGLLDVVLAAARTLRTGDALLRTSASVRSASGVAPVAAQARPGAAAGTFNVEVLQLASRETWSSAEVADATATLGIGPAELVIDGSSLLLPAGASLTEVRDLVNSLQQGTTASVVRVAEGAYRLALTSSSGARGIELGGDAAAALGLVRTRAGSDAVLLVDGIEVRRTSNRVDDVLEGVTLDLLATGGPAEVSIRPDHDALIEAARAFAGAFNAVRSFVDDQGTTGRPLFREPLLQSALASLRNAVAGDLLDPPGQGPSRLGLAGIEVDRQGRLQVDDARLRAVAAGAPEALQALLAEAGGRTASVVEELTRPESGLIAGRSRSMNDLLMRLNRQTDEARTRVDRVIDRLTSDFLRMEDALGRISAQRSWLSGQIEALQPLSRR